MDAASFLFSLLVVLVASRVAAEIAGRVGVPAVLLEILAGIAIGPSLLAIVESDTVEPLAELGVVLLLFEVGLQMNIRDLIRAGGDSLRVAFIGVALPLAGGFLLLETLGVARPVSLFIAGGITATSVGITARVFGELRALARIEARIVLGAAVADDVAGLIILALVSGLAQDRQVGLSEVFSTVGIAIGFLVGATVLGSWLFPRIVAGARRSRSEGSLAVAGVASALALAAAAAVAGLAPIVGAFVAGIGLSGSKHREELHHRLVPLGQLLIPIFFLQVGMNTRFEAMLDSDLLLVAALLSAVAIIGKLCSGIGVRRGRADRLLVGVAMVPRGEVGLIFASLGLSVGALDDRFYGVLVAVVMVTTVLAPPWIRHALNRSQPLRSKMGSANKPPGGWLQLTDEVVELAGEPLDLLAPHIGLKAAIACASRRPGPNLTRWIAANASAASVQWDSSLRSLLFALLERGNERSWKFLDNTGALHALLPSLDDAMRRRARDPFRLDQSPAWESLSRLEEAIAESGGATPAKIDLVRLAAVIHRAFETEPDPAASAGELVRFIQLDEDAGRLVVFLVREDGLLAAAASRPDATSEQAILELAEHIQTPFRVRALHLLCIAGDGLEDIERQRLDEVVRLLIDSMRQAESGSSARGVVEKRKEEIRRTAAGLPLTSIERFLDAAPRRYLLAHDPEAIRRHLSMLETSLARDEVRIRASRALQSPLWVVDLAFHDRPGALAAIATTFARLGIPIVRGVISTFANEIALDVFWVEGPPAIDWGEVREQIQIEIAVAPRTPMQPVEGIVEIQNFASPWYTIVEIKAHDRTDLLLRVASAITIAGAQIHQADVRSEDGVAIDTFFVTGRKGGKLEPGEADRLREALAGKGSRLRKARARGRS